MCHIVSQEIGIIRTVTCFSKFGPLILKHFTIGALGLTGLGCQIMTGLCLSSASTAKPQQGLVQSVILLRGF